MKINPKKALFTFGVFLVIGIVALFAIGGPLLSARLKGSLVGEPTFTHVEEGDKIYWGIKDVYKNSDTGETLSDFKAALKSEILSIEDLSLDDDDVDDLSILSSLVLGDTFAGEVEMPNYLDIYTITSTLTMLDTLGIMSFPNAHENELVIPDLNAIHYVSSEDYVLLQKILDVINEQSFMFGHVPLITFEVDDIGTYPGSLISEDADPDALVEEDAENMVTVIDASTADLARHNALEIMTNVSNAAVFSVISDNTYGTATSGQYEFWLRLPDANAAVDIYIGGNQLGIWLDIEDGELKYKQWNYEYDGTWDAVTYGNDIPIGYNITDTNWHKINLDFSTYDYDFEINVDEFFDVETMSYVRAFHNVSVPLSSAISSPGLQDWDTFSTNVKSSDANPARVMIDDIYVDKAGFSMEPDFVATMLDFLSIYHVSVLPDNFNYDLFYNIFDFFNQIINFSIDIVPFTISNTDAELRVTIPVEATSVLEELIEDDLLGMDITSWSGEVELSFELCWDKTVGMLNASKIVIYYPSLSLTRTVGIELIATTNPNDKYMNSPEETDYEALFGTLNAEIENARTWTIVGIVSSAAGGVIGGGLFGFYLVKRKESGAISFRNIPSKMESSSSLKF